MMPDAVDLELRCRGWHENGSLYLKGFTAVGDALCVIAGTCSDNSSAFLLLSHVPEGSGCPSYFEAPNRLKILPLEEDIG